MLDDKYLAAVNFTRMPYLDSLVIIRQAATSGGEAVTFAEHDATRDIDDLDKTVSRQTCLVVTGPDQGTALCARLGVEAAVLLNGKSRRQSSGTSPAAEKARAVIYPELSRHPSRIESPRANVNF